MTNRALLPSHQALIDQLGTCVLSEMNLEPSGLWLRFDFESAIGGPVVILKLYNPALVKFSRTLDDEGGFVIGEAALSVLDDSKTDLAALGYGFSDKNGPTLSYPARTLLHFHLEGDICIDVICEDYDLRAQSIADAG
ncbi:MAG: hypothetical protein ACREDR_03500 [Blastocatellia bacterium]